MIEISYIYIFDQSVGRDGLRASPTNNCSHAYYLNFNRCIKKYMYSFEVVLLKCITEDICTCRENDFTKRECHFKESLDIHVSGWIFAPLES